MGAVSLGGVVASGLTLNEPRFCHDFRFRIATIFATIGHNRVSIVLPILKQIPSDDCGFDSTTKDPRSRLDRATIVVRSGRDRGVLPRIFPAVRWSFR